MRLLLKFSGASGPRWDYAPEFEAPSETVPAIMLQGPEHFEPHIDMRSQNPPLPPVAGEPDQSCLASH
jgi:hypothetical protein